MLMGFFTWFALRIRLLERPEFTLNPLAIEAHRAKTAMNFIVQSDVNRTVEPR